MDAKIPPGNDSERGHGSGDDGGRGGGRWDDDDDNDVDDNFFGPRKEQLSCGRRGKNRGRGGFAGNAFYSGGRGMGPSMEIPLQHFLC